MGGSTYAGRVLRRTRVRIPYAAVAIDVVVAGVAFVVSVGVLSSGGFGTPDPGTRGLDQTATVLGALATLPLVARRFAPLAVYLLTALATATLLYLRYPFELPLGVVIAAYEVACAYSGAGRQRRIVAMVAIGAFVPLITLAYWLAGVDLESILSGPPLWVAIFAGMWIAGDRTRLRRERLAGLEDQARRSVRETERERRLAAAEERTRIARELHDSAGHAINVILVQAGAARLLQERDPAGSRQAITTIEDVARKTIGEIDRLVRALRENAGRRTAARRSGRAGRVGGPPRRGSPALTEVRGEPRPLPRGWPGPPTGSCRRRSPTRPVTAAAPTPWSTGRTRSHRGDEPAPNRTPVARPARAAPAPRPRPPRHARARHPARRATPGPRRPRRPSACMEPPLPRTAGNGRDT